MADEDLRALLEQLHTRLGRAKSVDETSRNLLATVSADIEGTLARSESADEAHAPVLEELAAKFETDHPQLANVLRQIVDTLGKAGI
ncbi:MAG TPA: DUF4404 family protein [Gammaproteobacteria bacterium]|nr:DUF4404 family protein [Gammaproteobacteria bacterium]